MKKPVRPTLKKYGITEDQVNRLRSFYTQRNEIFQSDTVFEDGDGSRGFTLWWKHSFVFACIIAVWYIHDSSDPFLESVFSGIFAGGFGGIIPGGITSYLVLKNREKRYTELQTRLLVDMDVDKVESYISDFDSYQSDLMTYENFKSKK
jgi:hypothetical protein